MRRSRATLWCPERGLSHPLARYRTTDRCGRRASPSLRMLDRDRLRRWTCHHRWWWPRWAKVPGITSP